ncbi:MAG: TetR family transcriptional regulator [Acidimicrobiales bacterium]
MAEGADDDKRLRILDAALAKFSAYGFARTSMADIAEAASMSRPALYQHYGNKEEIFRAMLERVFTDAADSAIASLVAEGDLEGRLDGFLQRWSGDLMEKFRSTEHGNDLVEAKAGHAKSVVDDVNRRVRKALEERLGDEVDDPTPWIDLLLLSPLGFKYDEPTMLRYRRRLAVLAASVAGSIGAGSSE